MAFRRALKSLRDTAIQTVEDARSVKEEMRRDIKSLRVQPIRKRVRRKLRRLQQE